MSRCPKKRGCLLLCVGMGAILKLRLMRHHHLHSYQAVSEQSLWLHGWHDALLSLSVL
jgi:hypothetical protein